MSEAPIKRNISYMFAALTNICYKIQNVHCINVGELLHLNKYTVYHGMFLMTHVSVFLPKTTAKGDS